MSASNLPTDRVFRADDMPGKQSWIDPLINWLTRFTQSIYSLMDGGLSYAQNLDSEIFTGSFTFVTGTPPSANFKTKKDKNPVGVILCGFSAQDNSVISDATQVFFKYTNQNVAATFTSAALSNGKAYNFSLLVMYT